MDADSGRQALTFVLANAQGWMIYPFILLAIAVAWWSWARYGPRPPGTAGAIARCCRVAGLVTVLICISDPSWRETTSVATPGRIAILVDSSTSMLRDDAPDLARRIDATHHLRDALSRQSGEEHLLSWYRIGGSLEAMDDEALDQLAATGTSSPLGQEIATVAERMRYDLLIVVSDGRVNRGPDLATVGTALGRARNPEHGVWTLAVGSDRVDRELHIDEIEGNRTIALDERQPFEVRFSGRALGVEPITVTLLLDDNELDSATIEPDPQADELDIQSFRSVLMARIDTEGRHDLTAVVRQGDDEQTMRLPVEVVERRLTVLMLAHWPRYELRYLRNALDRDPLVEIHAYLADGGWRRWGDSTFGPEVLPLGSVAIQDYDAFIIGDIDAHVINDAMMRHLIDAVEQQGAGLIWLPGERGAIAEMAQSLLGRLMPVELPDATQLRQGFLEDRPLGVMRSPSAMDLNLFPPGPIDWPGLPRLRGRLPITALRPGAQALMLSDTGDPLVVSRRFGAGLAAIVAVDDTWRWRRNAADAFLHRFYSPLLRHVSQGRGLGAQPWRMTITPHRNEPGAPLELAVVPDSGAPDDRDLPQHIVIELSGPQGHSQRHMLQRLSDEPSFTARIATPPHIGSWQGEVIDGLAGPDVAPADLIVLRPQLEARDPRIDDQALRLLSQRSGGRSFTWTGLSDHDDDRTGNAADRLSAALPSLTREERYERLIRLWDRAWILLLIAFFFSLEWGLRRHHRLP